MTATRSRTLTAAGIARLIQRGVRANLGPEHQDAEIARLAERFADMAASREMDADLTHVDSERVRAERDALWLGAIADELQMGANQTRTGRTNIQDQEVTIRATEHASAPEALQYLDASGDDHVILIPADRGGAVKYLTLTKAEAERIEMAGIKFAYLFYHASTGQITTLPVNDD